MFLRRSAVLVLLVVLSLPLSCGSRSRQLGSNGLPLLPDAPVASQSRLYTGDWMRGISLVAWDYDTYTRESTLRALNQLPGPPPGGHNMGWVQISPVWYMNRARDNAVFADYTGGTVTDDSVRYIIQQIHARGMKVMLKPLVNIRDGTWRGDIRPKKTKDWFNSYQAFITRYAQIAKETMGPDEVFSIGCEFNALSGSSYTSNWRTIIQAVRGIYPGRLTYAANWGTTRWGEYYAVQFWRDLDYIGIDAFFPVTSKLHPTVEDVKAGWYTYTSPQGETSHWVDEMKALSDANGKKVIFTEIGFDSVPNAGDIWYTSAPGVPDMEAQRNCVEGTLQVFDQLSWFAGMFWWTWSANPDAGGPSDTGMDLNNKPAAEVIAQWFGGTGLPDALSPMAPTGLTAAADGATQVKLAWKASTDNAGVTGYRIYRNGTEVGTATDLAYTDTGLIPSTAYAYQVSAYDAEGNLSPKSNTANATTASVPDTEPPGVPTGLRVAGVTSIQVSLAWNASTDNVAVAGYHIFRDGTQVGTSSTLSYNDTGLTPGTTYSYQVDAYDAAGNRSGRSDPVPATTPPDTQAPTVPTGLMVTGVTNNSITLRWNPSTDNVAVAGYYLQRDGQRVATITTTTHTDTGLTAGTSYAYQMAAFDSGGNTSDLSAAVTGTTTNGAGDGYGFEDGTQGWFRQGAVTDHWNEINPQWVYEGARSLGVQVNKISNRAFGDVVVQPPKLSLVPGRTVSAQLLLRSNSNRVAARVWVSDQRGEWLAGPISTLLPNAWTQVTLTIPTSAQAPLTRLGIQFLARGGNYSGLIMVDDVRW